jgi:hypothetical protein
LGLFPIQGVRSQAADYDRVSPINCPGGCTIVVIVFTATLFFPSAYYFNILQAELPDVFFFVLLVDFFFHWKLKSSLLHLRMRIIF